MILIVFSISFGNSLYLWTSDTSRNYVCFIMSLCQNTKPTYYSSFIFLYSSNSSVVIKLENPLSLRPFISFLSPVHSLHLNCLLNATKAISSRSTSFTSLQAIFQFASEIYSSEINYFLQLCNTLYVELFLSIDVKSLKVCRNDSLFQNEDIQQKKIQNFKRI